jgi:hypothetical protein
MRHRNAVTETTSGCVFTRFGARSLVSFNLRWCEWSVADDYFWSGSTIFSLANPSLFGYTEYTFNVTVSSASAALQFEGFSIAAARLLDDVSVNPAEWVSLMAARQFVYSVSLCSA